MGAENTARLIQDSGARLFRVSAKTAAYTISGSDGGTIFTDRGGSGAFTLTLPDRAAQPTGWCIVLFLATNNTITLSRAGSDTIIAGGNTSATSISFTDAGGCCMVWNDGSSWLITNISDRTMTVA